MDRARRWQWSGVVAGSAVFVAITIDFLAGGPVSGYDQAIYDRVTAWQAGGLPVHWWAELVTKPASPPYATAITAIVVVWWWARGQRRLALWAVGTSAVAALVITVLKQGFRRGLPPLAEGAWYGYSFPSGHTIGAAANLGILILLGAQVRIDRHGLQGTPARRLWAFAVVAWALVTVLTGVGRVLTQRHWASDVLASWAMGTALACGALLLARVPAAPAELPQALVTDSRFVERAT